MLRFAIWLSVAAAASTVAADPFLWRDTHAQFRDAVIDPAAGRIYVAVYDRGEVWAYDAATLERVGRVETGDGPVALALEGSVLACANRNSATVTLIQTPELTVLGELSTGAGPVGVASLGDGRFAVVNSFDDSATLISVTSRGAGASPIAGAPAVPIGAAADEEYLALIGRVEPSVSLYTAPAYGAAGRVPLSETPLEIAALGGGRFVVRTASTLALVDAASASVSATKQLAADAVDAGAGKVHAVAGNTVHIFDSNLNPVRTLALAQPASMYAVQGNTHLALTPKHAGWQIWHEGGVLTPAPAATQAPAIASAAPQPPLGADPVIAEAENIEPLPAASNEDELVAEASPAEALPEDLEEAEELEEPLLEAERAERIEAGYASEQDHTAPPPEDAEFVLEATEEAEPMDVSAPVVIQDTDPEAAESIEPDVLVEQPEQEERPKPSVYTEGALPQPEIRAPALSSRRPSPVPLGGAPEQSISDMFSGEVGFDTLESALQAPDWTQPLRDIEADTAHGSLDTDVTVWEGNVRLRLENTFFQADRFEHTRSTGEMVATGNVRIMQDETLITADQLSYQLPLAARAEEAPVAPDGPALLESTLDEQTRAKRSLSRGTLIAYNIRVVQPFREFQAEYVEMDLASSEGEMRRAEGTAGVYYVFAEHVEILGPESFNATGAWITTCASPAPPYRINIKELQVRNGEIESGKQARLQLGKFKTPIFVPFLKGGEKGWNFDFDSGREANIGFFVNTGAQYQVTPDLSVGPRLFATEDEGVGLGGDLEFDYMENPASRFFRNRGEAHGLYTTEERGYLHMYHRFEPDPDLVLRTQVEQWSDEEFYKDFFFEEFRDRTAPRTFANLTYRQPTYIASGTVRPNTHGWVTETERLPEVSFHLMERQLLSNLYVSYDTINGYNDRNPLGGSATRLVHVGRLTYDLDLHEALSITPFYEAQASWYSEDRLGEESIDNFASTAGVTLQTRLHRVYDGRWGFEAFKHVFVPSITYSYRPDTSIDAEDLPRFDALDNVFGRSRIETKLDNVVYGKDAESGEVWQVARLTLYQGNDFWNESHKADDYEVEVDIRPRPWWGMQLVGERHVIGDDLQPGDPFFFQQLNLRTFEALFGRPYSREAEFLYNAAYNDYSRVLGQFYYDNTLRGGRWQGRLGYAYTETADRVFNQEFLYGAGYKLSEKWGVGFEHRYDFEDDSFRSQSYEVRRSFQCWDTSLRVRDRESGLDIDLEFSITALPGAKLKL